MRMLKVRAEVDPARRWVELTLPLVYRPARYCNLLKRKLRRYKAAWPNL